MASMVRCAGVFPLAFPSRLLPRQPSSTLKFVPSRSKRRLTVLAERNSIDAPERILAASGYFLPFLDGVQYGRFFFTQFPASQVAFQPFFPVLRVYSSTPFASVAVFFGLYFLLVRNPNFSRYVRFNTMQAVILDVLLVLPNLLEGVFDPKGGIGFELLVIFYNTVFLYMVSCFLFGTVSCLLGRTPRLPLVADAADAQVM